MTLFRGITLLAAFILFATPSIAQEHPLVVDGTIGYTGLVDDATDHFLTMGGAVRAYLTPRVSVGPEFVFMTGSESIRDRALMLTGNVVFDVFPPGTRPVTPFLVGGLGMFWSRESFPSGPFWSSDPAFTVGGGVRARLAERVSLAAEYRLGWELHHRITGSISFNLR